MSNLQLTSSPKTGKGCPPCENPCQCKKARNRNKKQEIRNKHTDWEGRNKNVSICKWHDCEQRKSKRILVSFFGKITEYEATAQTSVVFLHASSEGTTPDCYETLIFLQRCQVNSMEGRPPFSTNSIETMTYTYEKRGNFRPLKSYLKWIINLNVKPKATKILDKNHGRKYLLTRDKQRFLK